MTAKEAEPIGAFMMSHPDSFIQPLLLLLPPFVLLQHAAPPIACLSYYLYYFVRRTPQP